MINNFFTVKNSLDKHQTLSYLKNKGIDVPKNGIVGETFPNFFPVIIKPRYGQGSKGVRIVYKEEELQPSLKDFVWQELLLPEDQEFTCPVYKFGKSGIRSLILKRKMMNGMTLSGTVVKNKEIENYIEKISNKMELEGSINIQLRMTKNGPILFEINQGYQEP